MDILITNFDVLVMEISVDIFLFFWMEKKLILSSHICSIEYMGLNLLFWSFELNGRSYSTKNYNFWFSSYLEKGNNIFHHCRFAIFFFCIFQTVQNYMTRLNLAIENLVQFKCFWIAPRGSNCQARLMPSIQSCNWKYSEVKICARRFGLLKNKIKINKFLVLKNETCF